MSAAAQLKKTAEKWSQFWWEIKRVRANLAKLNI